MNTNTDPRIDAFVASLIAADVPRVEAVAIATAIEHAMSSPCYAAQYGSFCVDALNGFLNRIPA